MPNNVNSTMIDWKRLWQLVSGIHFETPDSTVLEHLVSISKELQDGLLQFKPKSASNIELEELLKQRKQEKLLPFAQRLQELLDLESKQCWEILCYYLTKEYRGSASFVTALISSESNMTKLLDDIWNYYSLQRMIVLKIAKNMITFYNVSNHPYHKEYKQILDQLTLQKFCDSYVDQLDYLIHASPPTELASGKCFNFEEKLVTWSERNAREINEVLHILILICEHLPITLPVLTKLFFNFKYHSFGKQQSYLSSANAYHSELFASLAHSELMLLLKCLDYENVEKSGALVSDIFKTLGDEVVNMYHSVEHGPLLLVWMLLDLRSSSDYDNVGYKRRCHQFGKRALDLNCFVYLHRILKHDMFQDDSLVSRIVRKVIYNQLCYMCDLFDADGSCSRYTFIYELLSELLSWPQLAKEFCSSTGGVRSLFNTLLETFPLDFVNMSLLACALTKAGQGSFIKNQLESLPILTEIYDDQKHKVRSISGDEYVLVQDLQPFPRIDFLLPAGTSACIMTRSVGCCVHFRTSVNYFNVLHHEINKLLKETIHLKADFQVSEPIRRVETGLQYLNITMQRVKTLSNVSVEMVHPTEMCIDILNKFKVVQRPPIKLLATCLDVCTALLPLADADIFMRVYNLNILPTITSNNLLDYKSFANGKGFRSNLLGCYIDDVEKKSQRYDFLLAYLNFLRTYTKLQRKNYFEIEIPGMVFILRDVLPNIHTWHFSSQTDKHKIIYEVLSFICEILDNITSLGGETNLTVGDKKLEVLRDVCLYSLLNLENGLVLLRFVGLGNAFLQHSMELKTNWMLQQPHSLIMLVRLSMRILMQLFRLRHNIFEADEVSPLETVIYTQPKQRDALRIIPKVTSYMSNIFDRWLPILSCRLLKRIALEFNMSLLACLDMEADQIRLTFLQILPDEFESDSVKIAILELIDACIQKQPGVTEAFFKVGYKQERQSFYCKKDAPQIAKSILTYMEEFLDANDAQNPITFEHPLPCKIMNLFHSLWKQNLQMLVKELTQKPKFWIKLCNPLFSSSLRPNVQVYTQLLNILAIEIYSTTNGHKAELSEVVLKLFERKYLEPWLKFIFNMPKMAAVNRIIDEMPDWICRLQAFKDFILILLRKQPQFVELPNEEFRFLAQNCVDALVDRATHLEDMQPFILLSELFLVILLKFQNSYAKCKIEERELMVQLLHLLGRIGSCYEDLHVRSKEACLLITIKFAQLHKELLVNDSTISLQFLNSVVNIICMELQSLENSIHLKLNRKKTSDEINTRASTNTLILSLNMLKTLATIYHNDGPINWDIPFVSARIFRRLLSCAATILQMYNKQSLSIELLDVLIVFAKGHCSAEFLYCDVGEYLWLTLLPPHELIHSKYDNTKPSTDTWTPEKWWPIYTRGLDLVTTLYEKHSNLFLKDTLQFIGIHEHYLVDALLLGQQSLEPSAIYLIKSAISLIAKFSERHKEWREDHPQSLHNIMRSVQNLMGYSISMFHQPKNLRYLITGSRLQLEMMQDNENTSFTYEMVNAFDDLTEIIIFCVKALQKFSPDLISLLCDPVFEAQKWEPVFEIDFGGPKLSETNVALTFGLVLSIVGVYIKVLNLQNHSFHEVPLNTLPTADKGTVQEHCLSNNAPDCRQTRIGSGQHYYSKSNSTVSNSSNACPSIELLSNLDGALCLVALEHILMLSATQSMFALKITGLDTREKQLIRREITSELVIFHEFVRRKVVVEHREQRGKYMRRKYGQMMLKCLEPVRDTPDAGVDEQRRRPSIDVRDSMRVNVVRRVHYQQKHQQVCPQSENVGHFEMSRVLSPITKLYVRDREPSSFPPKATISSTPNLARPPIRSLATNEPNKELKHLDHTAPFNNNMGSRIQQFSTELNKNKKIQYFSPDELQGYLPLSAVQFVEEDYLHFMSNLFNVICQNE